MSEIIVKWRRAAWQYRWWGLAAGIGLAALAVILWLSPSFEACFNALPYNYYEYSYYEQFTFTLLLSGRYAGCVSVWADGNAGAITALATIVIAVYTYTLWHVGNGQLVEVRKQIELAREEFSATHRPKLRVRHIRPRLVDGEPITVTCVVANVGEGEARVQPVPTVIIRIVSRRHGTHIGDASLTGADLWGGVSVTLPSQPSARPLIYNRLWAIDVPPIEGSQPDYMEVIGEFVYADDRNIERRTGFRRLYDPETNTFRPAPNPDAEEEYED